jgi:excisionase family DNA binding protein
MPLIDAACYAGVPVRTMRDWVSKGLVPAYRIGPRQIQIDRHDIDRLRKRIPAARSGGAS